MPPTRRRGRHIRRLVKAAAVAGGRRLIRTSEVDDRAFGDALLAELDTMKGMAMKVGQILSYMDGAVPAETQVALARLQRGVKPVEFAVIDGVIEASFGARAADCFDRFDVQPIAAASIGQVHRASTGGRELAVKVQYPGIRETFESDFGNMRRLSRVASLATSVDGLAIVEDLRLRLLEECDYEREAQWVRWFGDAVSGLPHTRLPRVVDAWSTDKVLTTTWCEGRSLEDLLADSTREARDQAAMALARFTWFGLWTLGTIHADPHPGNQLYAPDGAVVFLDFGCVRSFESRYLTNERKMVTALLESDRAAFREAVHASGIVAVDRGFDWDDHWAMMRHMWEPYLGGNYRFSQDYLNRGLRFTGPGNPNLRKLAIPPEWIWIQRVQWGLHAVLTRMGAEGRFGDVLREAMSTPRPDIATPAPEAA